MNTTLTTAGRHAVRSLGIAALAVPMAAALTLGAGAVAHADEEPVVFPAVVLDQVGPALPEGPGDLGDDCEQTDTCGDGGEEEPDGTPNPDIPEGPGDLTTEEDCQQTDSCGGGGGDEDPDGTPNPDIPEGPDGYTTEEHCQQTDTCGGGGAGGGGGDEGGDPEDGTDSEDYDKPTRIDAGAGDTGVGSSDTGLDLSWALPGGLLVSAAGLAFAARRTRSDERG